MRNVVVPTSTYDCTWFLEGKPYSGQLVLEPGRAAQGQVYSEPGRWSEGEGFACFDWEPTEHDRLTGELAGGQKVMLIDVLRAPGSLEAGEIFPRLALVGRFPAGDDPLFEAVRFQVGGLSELAGVPALSRVGFPRQPERSFTATVHPHAAQNWECSSGERITLEFEVTQKTDLKFNMTVAAQPVVEVTGTARTVEQWIDDFVRPLAELAAFATGRRQDVEWVVLRPEDARERFTTQLFAAGISQVPYLAARPADRRQPLLLRLGPDGADLAVVLERWRALAEEHEVLHQHLITMARQGHSTAARFLSVVPALEAYHGRTRGKLPRAEFKKQRQQVLERLDAAGVEPQDCEWVDTWLPETGDRALHERLRQLAEGMPASLQARTKAATEPLPKALHEILKVPLGIWHVVAKVRNNLAHGGDRPQPGQVELVCSLADTLAAALVLQELGVPEDLLVEAVDNLSWRLG
ncbi:HEPN domain-containing protein [Kitasatospora purpeofusca]|uniref:ApeA N-terminal domain 1-containing protein n=1 Tax=Kitasatospora purpeofusca TaxID=67352 RepID=UPI0035E376DF